MSGLRLHIGGRERRDGWMVLDSEAREHVDHVGDCRDLSFLADASCDEIYASHVIEHLGYDRDVGHALKEFHRVLVPGGRLRLSVPCMETLCALFVHPQTDINGKFHIMRMLFGGRLDAADVHLTGFNFDFLRDFLTRAGFQNIRKVEEFHEFEDTSRARFKGVLVSCNVEAFKLKAMLLVLFLL
jgi:predicted SAM-dependent methyltransferase